MDEAMWLACADPIPMLSFWKEKASDRKLRLFSMVCCWRVRHFCTSECGRRAFDVADRFVEGLASDAEREETRLALEAMLAAEQRKPFDPGNHVGSNYYAHWVVACALMDEGWFSTNALYSARNVAYDKGGDEGMKREEAVLAAAVRDIFGNPFRSFTFDPAWRTSTVTGIAQAAYEERHLPSGELDPTRLAILADALEDAGCTDRQILDPLREPGPHVRGCFAVDLLLAKE